jgi:hypothetical protein
MQIRCERCRLLDAPETSPQLRNSIERVFE